MARGWKSKTSAVERLRLLGYRGILGSPQIGRWKLFQLLTLDCVDTVATLDEEVTVMEEFSILGGIYL